MFAQLVPGPLVRFFARPYVAGGDTASALKSAALNLESGLYTTLDLLGEDVTSDEQVQQSKKVYSDLIRRIASDARFKDSGFRPTVSLKPSAFTTGGPEAAFDEIDHIVDLAREKSVALTIDMEHRGWTDVTLERSVGYFEQGYDVGTVVQTRLNRTEADLERIPAGMRVRLVIGIYPEPRTVATTSKREMKERMLTFGERLLARGVKVEFATHDDAYIEKFARELAPQYPEHCEVQMLLGVPKAHLQTRLIDGDFGCRLPVRLYVPFALSWSDATAYLRRRMAESPSMVWLVLRNLLDRQASRPPARRALPPSTD